MTSLVTKRLPKASKVWQLMSDDVTATNANVRNDAARHPTDVACLGPYTFVVADSVGHRLLVVDLARNICSCLAEGQVWPNSVAITKDSKIRVTDRREKAVKTYDLRGDLLSIWDPGEEVMTQPHGIGVTSRGETVVTDTETHSVFVFSAEGRLQREFGSKGDLLQQLRLPFYCAVDARDNILVSDNMNYCVKIFDSRGNYLRKIGSGNSFGQRQFQCPYGVCVDPNSDEVLVADFDGHRVFAFSVEGKFLRYVVAAGAEGVQNPAGVAVGPCGIMAVTECGPDSTNVKAFRMYESRDESCRIEQVWNSRVESAV